MQMTQQEVVDLMKSSKTEQEWNENRDLIKVAFGGDYPKFWHTAVIASGLLNRTVVHFH